MTRWDIDLDASGSDIPSMTLGIPVPMSALTNNCSAILRAPATTDQIDSPRSEQASVSPSSEARSRLLPWHTYPLTVFKR